MKQKTKNRLITASTVILIGASVTGAFLGFKGWNEANKNSGKIEAFMAAKDSLEKREEDREKEILGLRVTIDSLRNELEIVQKQKDKEIEIHDELEKRVENTEFNTLIGKILEKTKKYNKRGLFEKIFGCGRPKLPETEETIESVIETYMLETGKLSNELTAQEIFEFMVEMAEKE